jgi:spore maturation protein CgeB
MKILFSGYHNPNFLTITEYMERAIESLGHELFVFDDRQHVIPGRMRQRVKWLDRFDLQHINKKMISLSLKTNPDIAIVTGGHRITPQTIRSLKDSNICTVLWTIDPPKDFQPILNVAPLYDHIFCQGTEAVDILKNAGIEEALWLPVACDPDQHKPVQLSEEERAKYGNDVVFVGSYYPTRAELFEELADFDLGIWGPGWEKLDPKSPLRGCLKAAHTKPLEWLKIYSASKIVLATHYQDPERRFPVYQASPRIFEAMACGAFVISDNQRDVLSLFKEGEHLARFIDSDDLIEKIKYYLDRPIERQEMAQRGRQYVLGKHTYVQRIKELLSYISVQ